MWSGVQGCRGERKLVTNVRECHEKFIYTNCQRQRTGATNQPHRAEVTRASVRRNFRGNETNNSMWLLIASIAALLTQWRQLVSKLHVITY